jgi:O-antigen ligase
MSIASTAAAGGIAERNAAWGAGLAAFAVAVFLFTPRASPGALGLLALAMGAATGFAVGFRELLRLPLAAVLVAALGGWGLVSLGWAADQKEALGKSLMLIGFTLATVSVQTLVRHAEPVALRRIAVAVLVTFAAGVFYLIVEEMTDHLLKRTFFRTLPFTMPVGKLVTNPDGDISLAGYISNRNMAAMVLASWPVLLIAIVMADGARKRMAVVAVAALAFVAMAMSVHETSIIAVAAGSIVFAVAFFRPKVGLGVVAAGWLIATLLVVPLVSWASSGAQLHSATWLPNSARHRIVLWAYTAEQVRLRPLTGVGAASTKLIDARRGPRVAPLPGTNYEWRSGPHAHNVYLQTWYELGAFGALLLCAAGLALIAGLSRLPLRAQPYAAAAVTTAAVMAAFSWGMWQAWFLGVFMVSAVLMTIAIQTVRHGEVATGVGT